MVYAHLYSKLRLTHDSKGRFYVQFYFAGKRFRYSNGEAIGVDIKPNAVHGEGRKLLSLDLLTAYKKALDQGWNPRVEMKHQTLFEALNAYTPPESLSRGYQVELSKTLGSFLAYIEERNWSDGRLEHFTRKHFLEYLNASSKNPSFFNHERARLSSIIGTVLEPHDLPNPLQLIKKVKLQQAMHKPFNDVHAVLQDIKAFNENLFLCCLLTYGCLLRPHQEIRQLTWSDFSDDLEFISLSGKRNKSGRNRIVPISPYIRQHLHPSGRTHNIFTGSEEQYNACYFKTLWSRYKKQSKLLEANQTLYSFRHTGAIEVYKKTKDIAMVQQVMGHASMQVTLGYLRNLEVPVLRVEDMPKLNMP
jgi:integrase